MVLSSRFTRWQSALVGGVVRRLVVMTGGECGEESGLQVCRTGWLRLYARRGTQWGDSFVTGLAEISPGLVLHEKHHRDAQWRRYGIVFGFMYLMAEIWDRYIRRRPSNRYERDADAASEGAGGYGQW